METVDAAWLERSLEWTCGCDKGFRALHEEDARVIFSELERKRKTVGELCALLVDCAEHFKTLREANVFVWPNHPLNPEARIAEALRKAHSA